MSDEAESLTELGPIDYLNDFMVLYYITCACKVQFIFISEISCCVGTRLDPLTARRFLNLPFITLLISVLPLLCAYCLGLVLAPP